MTRKFKQLMKSKFIKNVTIMATGTIGAQIVVLIFAPIITRLYGPDVFGVMGTFNSMINMVVPIAALTYPIAIVLPKNKKDARGLIYLSLIITLIISIISLLILILAGDAVVHLLNLKEVAAFIYLIPLVIILSGLMQVLQQWLIRTQQFTITAKATFYQSIIINSSKVGFGYFIPIASVLVFLTTITNGLKALLMFIFIKRKINDHEDVNDFRTKYQNEKTLLNLAKEYKDFPMYRAPETFLNAISQGLPVLLLSAFFGPAAAGYYTIGWTVLSLPTRLIGDAVGDVFYPRIVEGIERKEKVDKLIKKATFMLAGIGIIPFGIIIMAGPFLFSFIFGDDWVTAGEYARWIALLGFTNFINKPSIRSLAALNAQRFHLFYTITMLITRVILLGIGFYVFSSDIVSIALFSVSGVIFNLLLISITIHISKKK